MKPVFGLRPSVFLLFFLCWRYTCISQPDSSYSLSFTFNNHEFKEVDNKIEIRPVGVYLTRDRFGNEQSAVYLQGAAGSYLNLGTSPVLKPAKVTISLWFCLERRVYTGTGYESNPIIVTKNGPGDDFYCAYELRYDGYSDRYAVTTTKDSTMEATVLSRAHPRFNIWQHFVLSMDDNQLAFYIDGQLQARVRKGFRTRYLETDSVVVGHTANKKNFRFTQGSVDDIKIFHRVLSDKEVMDLYRAPDPNRFRLILSGVLKTILVLCAIVGIAYALVAGRRRALKREKERFELKSRMSEMEIRVIRAQINPHFMSNCLSAIQDLILRNKVDKANEYLAKFSFIVRQVLNFSTEPLVTLREELEITQLNVELEQLRFDNKFIFSLQVDPSINSSSIYIPPLIFQPMVENAIWHGLLPLNDSRVPHLQVQIKQEAQTLVMVIEDNGAGMNSRKKAIGNSKGSKGINITKQRLDNVNAIYGLTSADISFEDLFDATGHPAGTRVTIVLPLHLLPDMYD